MSTILELFGDDHRRCDEQFAQAEAAARAGDMGRCAGLFETFRGALLRHIRLEEEVLFPGFEAATGNTGGPTRVMRDEHAMLRELMERLGTAAVAGATADYLAAARTLTMLLEQHNMKEEGILYPMCDRVLAHEWDRLRAQIEGLP